MPRHCTASGLLLLQAKVLADDGDVAAASALLASDARFWRMVHASADSLITKMIAGAALRRHFEWGNLVLRGFPAGRARRRRSLSSGARR